MRLFGKKKTKTATTPNRNVIRTANYIYTPDFRGTKKKNITVYGIETAEKGIKALKVDEPSFIMTGRTITVNECRGKDYGNYLQIFIDGFHVGNMYEWEERPDLWEALASGKAEKVHIKFEQKTIIGKSGRKLVTEIRYEPYIFVK